MDDNKANKIAKLNDAFRRSGRGGQVLKTQGIDALPINDQSEIFQKIKSFNDFSKGNDPYGEHDFGAVEHDDNKVFWKIDYYAPDMEHLSEDASDPDKTRRVMTIMLANEY